LVAQYPCEPTEQTFPRNNQIIFIKENYQALPSKIFFSCRILKRKRKVFFCDDFISTFYNSVKKDLQLNSRGKV
jgi:hypothetical protein